MSINRLDHVVVRVHDLDVARRWYTQALGLQELEHGTGTSYLSCDGSTVDLVLVPGGHGLEVFSLGVPAGEDLEAAEKQLRDRGFEATTRPDHIPGIGTVLEHRLPTGHRVQLVLGASHETGVTRKQWDGATASPVDMDHVTMVVPHVESATHDLIDRFSYKLTEAVFPEKEWLAAFLRTSDMHHDLGLVGSARPDDTLHHIAFWVDGLLHQEKIADRLADYDTPLEFGPGKHGGPANQLFMYAFDPSGNRVEFCGSMGVIVDDEPVMTGGDAASRTVNKWTPGYAPETFWTVAS